MGNAEWQKGGRTRDERSAGMVLFRTGPERTDGRLFLLLDYGSHWDYPKGHVEAGESNLTAALRELKEETGIGDARVIHGFEYPIVYFFHRAKKGQVRKTVTFFLATTDQEKVTISEEHEGYEWLPEAAVAARLTYPTAREVFAAATAFLSQQEKHHD